MGSMPHASESRIAPGTSPDPVEARLDRLERENRRLRRFGAATAVGAALVLLLGAHPPDGGGVLEGERLVLKSRSGEAGVTIGTSDSGEPVIAMKRTINGKPYSMNLRMFVADDGVPVLLFEDQEGIRRYKIPR